LYFVAELQYGSGKKTGLPKYAGQITFSSVSVACCPSVAPIAPFEYTAKCSDS
jgi:hypothetical protein